MNAYYGLPMSATHLWHHARRRFPISDYESPMPLRLSKLLILPPRPANGAICR
jgi:hypothetical protein